MLHYHLFSPQNKNFRACIYNTDYSSECNMNNVVNPLSTCQELVDKHWKLEKIYTEFRHSGKSKTDKRVFDEMLHDCEKGKFDLIVVYSIYQFSPSLLESVQNIKRLMSLNPPVGIYFLYEDLYSLDDKDTVNTLEKIAIGQRIRKSSVKRESIQNQFKNGIPICPTWSLLGYDKGPNGEMLINEKEAKIVKQIYSYYLDDMSASEIAEMLTLAKISTPRGKATWSATTILSMLQNERYCGDIIMQKTFTVNTGLRKVVKNTGQLPQYYIENHHEAIIDRETWSSVQHKIENRRRFRGARVKIDQTIYTPILTGMFIGFVPIQPNCDSISLQSLLDASKNTKHQIFAKEKQDYAEGF